MEDHPPQPIYMASLNYNCAKVDIIVADRTQTTAFFAFRLSPTLSEHWLLFLPVAQPLWGPGICVLYSHNVTDESHSSEHFPYKWI